MPSMPNRSRLASARPRLATAVAALVALLALTAFAPAADARCRGERSKSRGVAAGAMLCLVNQERTRRGIPALHLDSKLSRVAGRHARDMVRYSFTGHDSPKHGGLVQRVKRARVFRSSQAFAVGENLGWGGTPASINNAWMNSAIHRKATLFRRFSKVGVGVVRGLPQGSKRSGLTYVVTFAG